jgi:hypothetical protein
MGISQRTKFSIIHIQAAAYYARQTGEMEQQYRNTGAAGAPDERDWNITKHRFHVANTVISSAAFLEATINELFIDIVDEGQRVHNHDPEFVRRVQMLHSEDAGFLRPLSPLEKYQVALGLDGDARFDTGRQPYQDAFEVKRLRNALMYYTPQTIPTLATSDDIEPALARALDTKGFDRNPLVGEGNAFFPDQCFSYGCAEWVVESSIEFTNEFFDRIGEHVPYDHIRARLDTSI